jgi:hypothetical protein
MKEAVALGVEPTNERKAWTVESETALQLKISLVDSSPAIWRRELVPDSITLADLHLVIQIVMGWTKSHLHDFTVLAVPYAEFEEEIRGGARDSATVSLRGLGLNRKEEKFTYTYDLGDDWEHEVAVESSRPAEDSAMLPNCEAGRYRCPLEDSGGVHGYRRLLDAVADPAHPDHHELSEWLNPDFDPEEFDLDDVNRELGPVLKEL